MRGGWGGPKLPFVLGGYDKKHNNFDTNHVVMKGVMKGGWVQAAPMI